MAVKTFVVAMNEALHQEMQRDPSTMYFGLEGVSGGYFTIGRGLFEKFGPERVFDTPIAECAIAGSAVGMAITGLRPIADLGFADFYGIVMDELANKAAKWRYMHGGHFKLPIVYRMAVGLIGGAGAEHSQSPEAHFLHTPGLYVVMPSTPADAKGLLASAIRNDNPVLYFEHKGLYFSKGEVPDGEYLVPLGKASIRRTGEHVTVITWGLMVNTALTAAKRLAAEGVEVEIVDPRSLVPLDRDTILSSVRKTGRALILHEAPRTGGAGAEIAAIIAEEAMYDLQAPVRRVAGKDCSVPQNAELEKYIVPSEDEVVTAIRQLATA
jgi:acetoin:2,6-dichlorophenolindophenol oxidoreductase subunit beta